MIVTCTTTDVAHGGYCVARVDSHVLFVEGALPGETVDVDITRCQTRQWFGSVIGVRDPSPDRIPHVWPLAERTRIGGMDLGHVSLEAARRWKGRVIDTQMARLAHLEVSVEVEQAPGDQERAGLAWRTRASFAVGEDGALGMIPARSHRVVRVDSMPLAHEDIQAALDQDLEDGIGFSPGSTVTYVRSASPVNRLIRGAGRHHKRPLPHERSRTVTQIVPTAFGDLSYQVDADGFWQVHRMAPQVLVEAVLGAVGDPDGPVWDLYAGAGLFTVPLALTTDAPITAVEGSPIGVRALKKNTDPRRVTCLLGDVAEVVARLEPAGNGVVVCDPPRSGAGAKGIAAIVGLAPTTIVYVACDPASLARDVNALVQQGYELASLRGFDLFPYTHHVECVATLVRT